MDALGSQSAGEGYCVSFRDADVEEPARPFLLENAGPGSRGHGGGDDHEIGGLGGERGEGFAEGLGPGGRAAGLLAGIAGDRIVGGQPMPFFPVGLGQGKTLALFGQDVNHPGSG